LLLDSIAAWSAEARDPSWLIQQALFWRPGYSHTLAASMREGQACNRLFWTILFFGS
jgi:hypothetical protein